MFGCPAHRLGEWGTFSLYEVPDGGGCGFGAVGWCVVLLGYPLLMGVTL